MRCSEAAQTKAPRRRVAVTTLKGNYILRSKETFLARNKTISVVSSAAGHASNSLKPKQLLPSTLVVIIRKKRVPLSHMWPPRHVAPLRLRQYSPLKPLLLSHLAASAAEFILLWICSPIRKVLMGLLLSCYFQGTTGLLSHPENADDCYYYCISVCN